MNLKIVENVQNMMKRLRSNLAKAQEVTDKVNSSILKIFGLGGRRRLSDSSSGTKMERSIN